MIVRYLLCGIVLMALFITACGEPKADRIKRLVDAKVEKERLRLEAQCRSELLAKANDQMFRI